MAVAEGEGAGRQQYLAGEGQRQLEEAVAAAFQILTSINHELCVPALWSCSSPSHQQEHQPTTVPTTLGSHASTDAAGGGSGGTVPAYGGPLDDARHRYKTAVAGLRASIAAVSSCSQEIRSPDDKTNEVDIERLEERASVLRKEIESKNQNIKLLVDQLRHLIFDVSMWQSPCAV